MRLSFVYLVIKLSFWWSCFEGIENNASDTEIFMFIELLFLINYQITSHEIVWEILTWENVRFWVSSTELARPLSEKYRLLPKLINQIFAHSTWYKCFKQKKNYFNRTPMIDYSYQLSNAQIKISYIIKIDSYR